MLRGALRSAECAGSGVLTRRSQITRCREVEAPADVEIAEAVCRLGVRPVPEVQQAGQDLRWVPLSAVGLGRRRAYERQLLLQLLEAATGQSTGQHRRQMAHSAQSQALHGSQQSTAVRAAGIVADARAHKHSASGPERVYAFCRAWERTPLCRCRGWHSASLGPGTRPPGGPCAVSRLHRRAPACSTCRQLGQLRDIVLQCCGDMRDRARQERTSSLGTTPGRKYFWSNPARVADVC